MPPPYFALSLMMNELESGPDAADADADLEAIAPLTSNYGATQPYFDLVLSVSLLKFEGRIVKFRQDT